MPCRDDRDEPGYYVAANKELESRLDRITQFLCYMCGTAASNKELMPKEIQKWWEEHFSRDTERVLREMQALVVQHKFEDPKKLADNFVKRAEKVHPVSDFHKVWFLELAKQTLEREKSKIEARQHQEKLKKSALAKLSAEERKALGL